ncbi:MAG: DUF488 family protein [Planctomycetota bacterium]
MLRTKRIYEPPADEDGIRILVDRIWPRGVSKDAAQLDLWLKEIAPSKELRVWFGSDTDKWDEFKQRYFRELDDKPELVDEIMSRAKNDTVTLLFGKKDEHYNQAVALLEYLGAKS